MMSKRILLVDDEPDLISILGMRLELAGFDVIKAMDGKEALEKACGREADAYIQKPFDSQTLIAKIHSQLKQVQS